MKKFLSNEIKLDFSDVLIVPSEGEEAGKFRDRRNAGDVLSRRNVKLEVPFTTATAFEKFVDENTGKPYGKDITENSFTCVPIIAANMDGVGTLEVAERMSKNNMLTAINKSYSDEELDKIEDASNYFLTVGISAYDLERVRQHKEKFNKICIDTPNGYLKRVTDFVRQVRDLCGDSTFIMVGNVVTPGIAADLFYAGANCIKVGIGPGSVCTTRIKSGIGYPQLSTILEVAEEAEKINKRVLTNKRRMYVCADGGCTNPGDVAKAFVAGADFVMLGGMLAGHDEGGGEIITKYEQSSEVMQHPEGNGWVPIIDENKFVKFYGMSSLTANEKHSGGLKNYRAAEGKEVLVKYKGPLQNTIDDLLGGIRSACTYVNAIKLTKIQRNAKFVLVNNQVNTVFGNE